MMFKESDNFILNTDSYKHSHYLQYPPRADKVYSYVESRGGFFNETIFFGLQMFLREIEGMAFDYDDIMEAKQVCEAHGVPFNDDGWRYILDEHGGKLPLRIRAVPEGMSIPVHNVMADVENTDPACYWLTTFIETALLRAIWYPTTVATKSHEIKKVIGRFMDKTAGHREGLEMKLQDFGARGVSSRESAGIGGLAHLVNFRGTDTMEALKYANRYYGCDGVVGFSIPAAEHSTMTSWGKDREKDAYENMLYQFAAPGSIVAVVSDSYDIMNAARNIWGDELKEKVFDSGATIVIRPDSGDPVTVPVEVIDILMEQFGHTINDLGYKVLPDCIRVIQGDGIDYNSIHHILHNMEKANQSTENITFGMGGGLLQQVNRDTQKFAMKCSAAYINDEWVDVFKAPITDPGKNSKAGRLSLTKDLKTVRRGDNDILKTVFLNGENTKGWSLDKIRERADQSL